MSVVKQLRVLGALGRAVVHTREPSYLILYVNNVCNLRCTMCLTWDRMQRRTDDMSLDEFQRLARSFRNLVQLTITGGEPSLNPHVPEIVAAFYRSANLAKCTLVTNGTYQSKVLTIVNGILDRCPHLDLIVTVSLDGPREVHERIRGVPGCFDAACATLDRLLALRDRRDNLSVGVTSVISRDNWTCVEELYNWVLDRFRVDTHAVLLARGKTKELGASDVPMEAYRMVSGLLDREENRSRQYLRRPLRMLGTTMRQTVARVRESDEYVTPCVAGRKLIEIYSNGDVVPCELIEDKRDPDLGNVRDYDYDIRRLLQDRRAHEMQRFIHESRCRCTFECAAYASLAFNPMEYPRIIRSAVGSLLGEFHGRSRAPVGAERDRPRLQPC